MKAKSRNTKVAAYAAQLREDGLSEREARSKAEAAYAAPARKSRRTPRTKEGGWRKEVPVTRGPGGPVDAEMQVLGVLSRLDPRRIAEAAVHLAEVALCIGNAVEADERADKLLRSVVPLLLVHKAQIARDSARGRVLIAVNYLSEVFSKYTHGQISQRQLRVVAGYVLELLGLVPDERRLRAFVPDLAEVRNEGAFKVAASAVSGALGLGSAGRTIYNWRKRFHPSGKTPVAYGLNPEADEVADFVLGELLSSTPSEVGDLHARLKDVRRHLQALRAVDRAKERRFAAENMSR